MMNTDNYKQAEAAEKIIKALDYYLISARNLNLNAKYFQINHK